MKTILVPIDFSKPSEYAAKVAAKIATETNSSIHILHMVELPTGVVDMGAGSYFSAPQSMLYVKMIKEKMLHFKKSFFKNPDAVTDAVLFHNPFAGIKEYSKTINADLIVMGAKGHSELEEILIGSNTEKTVRKSDIPVIVVKKEEEDFKIKEIVYASDFNDDNKESFQKLLNFASLFNAKIHLLKINTIDNFQSSVSTKEKINEFISTFDLPQHTVNVYNDTSIESGVVHFAKEVEADLIAISTHGRSGLSYLFNGSITKTLSKSLMRPLITFKI